MKNSSAFSPMMRAISSSSESFLHQCRGENDETGGIERRADGAVEVRASATASMPAMLRRNRWPGRSPRRRRRTAPFQTDPMESSV
jgi:hypothetical protein